MFDQFTQLPFVPQPEIGRKPFLWGNAVQNIQPIPRLWNGTSLEQPLSRNFLFNLGGDLDASNAMVAVCIFAWGGMRANHAQVLFSEPTWPILDKLIGVLRIKELNSPAEVFDLFHVPRRQNSLPGLGIAYYSKLIYFLSTHLDVFILDQWIGKSMNLFLGENLISFTGNWVNDSNDGERYAIFCEHMMNYAQQLNMDKHSFEQKMFCKGGRNPGPWRRIVKQNLA